jgi:hypothetical protein
LEDLGGEETIARFFALCKVFPDIEPCIGLMLTPLGLQTCDPVAAIVQEYQEGVIRASREQILLHCNDQPRLRRS